MNLVALQRNWRPALGRRSLAGLLACGLLASTALSQTPVVLEDTKLLASDGAAGDFFGNAVAIDGGVALIGADRVDDLGVDSGAAYVFRFDETSWVEEAKLTPADLAAGDGFGRRLALDGDVAVVASFTDDDGFTDSGSVYVFRHDGTSWVQEQKLTAGDGMTGDQFGVDVDVDGDVLVVGTRFGSTDVTDSGSAYVYRYDGMSWNLEQKLFASDRAFGDRFGEAVALHGGVIAVGARYNDDAGSRSGSVYAFRHDGNTWLEEAKLTASDASGNDQFGFAVSVHGSLIMAGAMFNDSAASDAGAAYAFRFDGSSWSEEAQLLASDAASGDRFGRAIEACADVAVIGAIRTDDQGTNSGSAYVVRFDGTSWTEEAHLRTSDGAAGDYIGGAVAISGNVVVGARANDDAGSNSGSAYLYRITEAPTALAGLDQAIHAGDTVALDGTSSFDDDTAAAALGYSWSFVSAPAGSTAMLTGEQTPNASFVADVPGSFVVELTVEDACGLIGTDQVVISSNNVAPTADAGADELALLGDTVLLDGAGSNDPDGDALTYSWGIASAPAGSAALIATPTAVMPSITPDLEGLYVLSLQVSDPFGPGSIALVEITVTTAEEFATTKILETSDIIAALPLTEVTTQGNKEALGNHLSQATQALQKGKVDKAIRKIKKTMERSDGVALRGAPDGNGKGRDWITSSSAQGTVYGKLKQALDVMEY